MNTDNKCGNSAVHRFTKKVSTTPSTNVLWIRNCKQNC